MQIVSVSPQDKQPQMEPRLMQNGAPVGWTNLKMPRETASLACSLATSSLQWRSSSLQLTRVIDWNTHTNTGSPQVHGGHKLSSQPVDQKADDLTITPPSHPFMNYYTVSQKKETSDSYISQSNVATCLRCGGIFNESLLQINQRVLPVNEFLD